jgi:hypothetical protein
MNSIARRKIAAERCPHAHAFGKWRALEIRFGEEPRANAPRRRPTHLGFDIAHPIDSDLELLANAVITLAFNATSLVGEIDQLHRKLSAIGSHHDGFDLDGIALLSSCRCTRTLHYLPLYSANDAIAE